MDEFFQTNLPQNIMGLGGGEREDDLDQRHPSEVGKQNLGEVGKKVKTVADFDRVERGKDQIVAEDHKSGGKTIHQPKPRHNSVQALGEYDSANVGLVEMNQNKLRPRKRKSNIWSQGLKSVVPSERNSIGSKKGTSTRTNTPNILCLPTGVNIPMSRFSITPKTLALNAMRKGGRNNTVVPETEARVEDQVTNNYMDIRTFKIPMQDALTQSKYENNVPKAMGQEEKVYSDDKQEMSEKSDDEQEMSEKSDEFDEIEHPGSQKEESLRVVEDDET